MMKRILLVEDDEFLRAAIKDILESKGYKIFEAPNGKIARDILSVSEIDLVISDVQMPFMTGTELLEWLKKTQPIPFILMTGFSNLLEAKSAYELGADGFLTKPFKNKELIEIVQQFCIKDEQSPSANEATNSDSLYCKVSIDEFVTLPKVTFDIYVKLSEKKYIKIAHKNTQLQVDKIVTYKEKGLTHLYILREDFGLLVGFNLQLTNLIKENEAISIEKKLNFIKYTGETILEKCFVIGLDEVAFLEAKNYLETTIEIISQSSTLIELLNILNKHSDFIYAHSVGVALYSVMIANKLGMNSSQNIFKLSMAGIFHDIGKKEINREIIEKPRLLMSAKERVEFETHAIRSKEILENIRSFHSDIILMVYEHHEDCIGQGYPRGVSKNEMHPLSKILILSNRFAELTLRNTSTQQPMTAPIAIYHLETTGAERFDKNALDALKALVKMQ